MRFFFFFLLFILSHIASAQEIRGKLVDQQTREGIENVFILLANSPRVAISDKEGNFFIKNDTLKQVILTFLHVGYKKTLYPIKNSSADTIDIGTVSLPALFNQMSAVEVFSLREYPITQTQITKKELEKINIGQDIPFLLNQTPSLVASSDAGMGIGYTDMRIRGADGSRINVTINGVPVNDAESQGVFWVNLPDLSSSIQTLSIQRGVGSSVNGSGAFGASVHIVTDSFVDTPKNILSVGLGSFDTQKINWMWSLGKTKSGFHLSTRFSKLRSSGYIDRSGSDLESFFLSASYSMKKSTIIAHVLYGNEVTHQAWYGTPEVKLNSDIKGMNEYADNNYFTPKQRENLLQADRSYNHYIYDNEIDNYSQTHVQLFHNTDLSSESKLKIGVHYTKGSGYFEQYEYNKTIANYGIPPIEVGTMTHSTSDVIVQKWLDNDFSGIVFQFIHQMDTSKNILANLQMDIGGAYNFYNGKHFGDIKNIVVAKNIPIDARYYFSTGNKEDFTIYSKINWQLSKIWNFFTDIQYRMVHYTIRGTDNYLKTLNLNKTFHFFNPKIGVRAEWQKMSFYTFTGIGQKEPNRNDFVQNTISSPTPEKLINFEMGLSYFTKNFLFNANFYYMDYQNQLIATGELNDVGEAVRKNIPRSYRMGVELLWKWKIISKIIWEGNATISRNKIQNYMNYIINYDTEQYIEENKENSDIALSPNLIFNNQFSFLLFKDCRLSVQSKYISKQYLDNTFNDSRTIPSSFVHNLNINYAFSLQSIDEIQIKFSLQNFTNEQFATKGYTYSYIAGEREITGNHYYPQAPTHFLIHLSFQF